MIGIIAAMDVELEKLKQSMTDIKIETLAGTDFIKGTLWGRQIVAAVCGVGKVNAAMCAQTMILKFSPDFIINSGVAGGLDKELKVCSIVVAQSVVQHDMDTSPLGDPIGFISGIDIISIPCDEKICQLLKQATDNNNIHCMVGTIASGDQFISSSDKKSFLTNTFNATACEMEGGAIGHVCYKNNVPFCVIRSISDGADNSSPIAYPQFVKLAADNLEAVLKSFFGLL